MAYVIDTGTEADRVQVLEDHPRYWADRDLRAGHHWIIVKEFSRTFYVARSDAGIVGYLIGFLNQEREGYIHFVATRDDARKLGIARDLYQRFSNDVAPLGAVGLKAITSVENEGSIAFHSSIGFSVDTVDDYAGEGKPRIVFRRGLF